MKTELPTTDGKVISIETFLASRKLKAMKGDCPHNRLGIDPLDGLYCLDCQRQLNPIEWIIQELETFRRMHQTSKEVKRQEEALKERTRTKCIHCKQMTPVRLT